MIYREIVLDFPPEYSFNPLAILQDTLKVIVFHFRRKRGGLGEYEIKISEIYVGAIIIIIFLYV